VGERFLMGEVPLYPCTASLELTFSCRCTLGTVGIVLLTSAFLWRLSELS
jgi:hypothetical protein